MSHFRLENTTYYQLLTPTNVLQTDQFPSNLTINFKKQRQQYTIYTTEPSAIIASTLYNIINCSYGIQNRCKISSNIQELRDKIIERSNRNPTLIKHENNEYIRQLVTNNIENNSRSNHEMLYQYLCDPRLPYISYKCNIYYPNHFNTLRALLYGDKCNECNIVDINFIQSLSRCTPCNLTGGKKGSFCKTFDNKYLLKFIKLNEFNLFLEHFRFYFDYMVNTIQNNKASMLVPIIGCYGIHYKNSESNEYTQESMRYVLIMPNLFYSTNNENNLKKFDLKGTMNKNRYCQDNNDVQLDKNFIEYTRDSPIILNEESIKYLNNAINNDTQFLYSLNIVDYSFLIGINKENNEIIGGIIDYLQIYSLKKKAEKTFKSFFIKDSTIQKPLNYKQRFKESILNKYFLYLKGSMAA